MSVLTVLVLSDPNLPSLEVLKQLPPSARVVVGHHPDALGDALCEADVIVVGMGGHALFAEVFPKAPRVRWVHSLSAGVEHILTPELKSRPIPLTNARGVFARSLGEFVVSSMLFFAKDLRRLLRQQAERRWEQYDVEELHNKRLGIVGYGGIGRAAAERARPFGMKITALRRRPEISQNDPLVDEVLPFERLHDLMATSDYVVVAAALTPETRGMIGEVELRAMKPTGVIINVGRGPLIDEKALLRALQEKAIRGAALDVFEQEPLPSEHPFWGMENVLISPHSADHTATWLHETTEFFVKNFERFAKGEPLLNVVDKNSGY